VKHHNPREGLCRVCGITTITTSQGPRHPIYLRDGRVLSGHVNCDWDTPTLPPPPITLPAPPDTSNE